MEGVARSFRFSKENFTDGPAAKTLLPTPGSLGLILGWGTRSHTPQLSVLMPQLYIPCAATKTWHSQINEQKETGTLHLHTQSFYLNISDLFKMPLMSNFCVSSAQVKANHACSPRAAQLVTESELQRGCPRSRKPPGAGLSPPHAN